MGFSTAIGLLFGVLWSAYRHQTGQWLPSPGEFAVSMERRFPSSTAKAAVMVAIYVLFHLTIGQRAALTSIDKFAFWIPFSWS